MERKGRWLPDGVRVERGDQGRVHLRGGDFDGREFDGVDALMTFVRGVYPELQPPHRDN